MEEVEINCPRCGGDHLHKGARRIRTDGTRYRRYQCQSCGKYFQSSYQTKPIDAEPHWDYEVVEV